MPDFGTSVEPMVAPLIRRLAEAARRCDPGALAATWFDQTVWLRLAGAAPLGANPEVTNHFRRSLGGALGAGASPEAHAGRPCPWNPPSALDVFFREQMRGEAGLPKPFIPLARPQGGDLLAGLRVFGFATEWMAAIEHAFVDALRNRLPWRKLGSAAPRVADRWIETCEGLSAPAPGAVVVDWLTPLDAEKIDPEAMPLSIPSRLLRRVAGLAHWQDAELEADRVAIEAAWAGALADQVFGPAVDQAFFSGGHGRTVHADARVGRVALAGDLSKIWPLLLIGERTGLGRGTTRGRGQFQLLWQGRDDGHSE